jgi:hypothetical protein
VTEYRAYTVDADGHFDGLEPLISDNDDDAIAKACALLGRKDIELWSGARLVVRLPFLSGTSESESWMK